MSITVFNKDNYHKKNNLKKTDIKVKPLLDIVVPKHNFGLLTEISLYITQ